MDNETPEEIVSDETAETPTEEVSETAETETTETAEAEETSPADETAEASDTPELTIGGEASAEQEIDPNYKPVIRGRIDKFGVAMGTGRRKTSVARVRIKDGSGKITVNGRDLNDYFHMERDQKNVVAPLKLAEKEGSVDVWVRVTGGGTTGQVGAILLGISRALQAIDENLHHKLAAAGYLTRDSRMVERKKFGFKKARKSFQFSKR